MTAPKRLSTLATMAGMNKIERVTAVLEGRQPDRPPVSFWYHFDPSCRSGLAAAQMHLDHLRDFDLDFLKIMNDNGYPGLGRSPSVEQLRELPVYRGDEPEFALQLEVVAELAQTLRGRVLTTTTVFNPWATLRRMYRSGDHQSRPPSLDSSVDPISGRLLQMIEQDREAVAMALNNIAESLANFAAKCLEAGADGIFLSVRDDWVDGADAGAAGLYRSLVRPGDRRILEAAASGRLNLLHVCGQAVNFDAFADYPVAAINWADRTAGPAIANVVGKIKPAICAGVDNLRTLTHGKPEQCADQVADTLAQAGDRPVIIAPGCTYDPDTVPEENLRAICRAVRAGT
ncbi:MAG: hypothetical protein GY778_18695 [bacterium]|nr:hypothetical protein [bacterium]